LFKTLYTQTSNIIGIGNRLAETAKGITNQFSQFSFQFAHWSRKWEMLDREMGRKWAKALEPLMKQWNEWAIDFKRRWETLKLRVFDAASPILEKLLSLFTRLAEKALAFAEALVMVTSKAISWAQRTAGNKTVKKIWSGIKTAVRVNAGIMSMGGSEVALGILSKGNDLLTQIEKNTRKATDKEFKGIFNPGIPTARFEGFSTNEKENRKIRWERYPDLKPTIGQVPPVPQALPNNWEENNPALNPNNNNNNGNNNNNPQMQQPPTKPTMANGITINIQDSSELSSQFQRMWLELRNQIRTLELERDMHILELQGLRSYV
jgi:hypothetical protein